jgi:serine/threonine-protein kinase
VADESVQGQDLPGGWEGRVIDRRYRIVRPLGAGAMGAVFVAEHLGLNKQVALKVVHAEYAGNRELLARFAREAMAGSRIDHPSVVAALDYGALAEGGAYLVMPLVPGENLTDVLKRRGRLPWAEAVELGVQIADALAAAAAQGFVHRDLKPDNILIETRESGAPLARVIDFGIAKLSEDLSESGMKAPGAAQPLTKEGAIIGTPGYMAPEQALGKPATHAADLYSLGVVLWEALVGQPLWLGDSIQAILQAQLKLTPPAIRDKSPQAKVPAALEELVQQLLARRPEQRPKSALEVKHQLQKLLRNSAPSPKAAATGGGARQVWMVLFSMLAAGTVLGSTLALGPRTSNASGASRPTSAVPDLEPTIQELLTGGAPTREAAAHKLLGPQSAVVPAYARELARLELGKSCKDKRAALQSLIELGDERVSPALQRLYSEPATGCGPRKDQDCLSCLRRELQASVAPRG